MNHCEDCGGEMTLRGDEMVIDTLRQFAETPGDRALADHWEESGLSLNELIILSDDIPRFLLAILLDACGAATAALSELSQRGGDICLGDPAVDAVNVSEKLRTAIAIARPICDCGNLPDSETDKLSDLFAFGDFLAFCEKRRVVTGHDGLSVTQSVGGEWTVGVYEECYGVHNMVDVGVSADLSDAVQQFMDSF